MRTTTLGQRAQDRALVGDATATFEKGDWDAETVQAVHLASLKGEFAEIWSTEEVLRWIRDQ